jgi:hypothetical protein
VSAADYCAKITANCATDAVKQYSTAADCAKAAGLLPVGTSADTGGQDTLGCREYHAGNAAGSTQNATTHCPHAGPFGGTGAVGNLVCGPAAGANPNCEAFCKLAVGACVGANQVWATEAACATDCAGFAIDTQAVYGLPLTIAYNKNNFNCRTYHLAVALGDPGTHCKHIAKTSATCTQ